jgi:hypothetical protein
MEAPPIGFGRSAVAAEDNQILETTGPQLCNRLLHKLTGESEGVAPSGLHQPDNPPAGRLFEQSLKRESTKEDAAPETRPLLSSEVARPSSELARP